MPQTPSSHLLARTRDASRRTRTPFKTRRPPTHARGNRARLLIFAEVLRHRRLIVALLLCVAAGMTVQQLTPPPLNRISVVVAARDLPAGTSLSQGDFISMGVPQDMAISGAIEDPVSLAGRQLASPLAKGQIPTEANLLGPGLLTGAPSGSAAVPLRMADPSSIQLLSPGQLVNVVLTSAGSYDESRRNQTLAGPVPVLWIPGQGGKAGPWLGTSDTEGLVVVAADPQQAEKLAGASTQGKLFFVLVSSS